MFSSGAETGIRAAILLAGLAAILPLSWRSLRAPGSHGFYRFFAFLLLLAVIVWNVPAWFRDPLSPRQLLSWALLAVSLGLAIEAFRLLRKIGRPAREARPGANLRFENTTVLVASGLYRFIRHPAYASLLALGWGTCLKDLSIASVALAAGASAFLTATALAEERENLARFGPPYREYMKRTRRFVPFLV